MASVSTTVEIDPVLARESQALFQSLGLSVSQAVNLFLSKSVRAQALPFSVDREEAEREAYFERIRRGLEQVHAGQGIVKTMDELRAIEEKVARDG